MKVLAIDAGNTRIKWGLADAGGWVRQGWVDTPAADTLAGAWTPELHADHAVVSNVAGPTVRAAIARSLEGLGVKPAWAGAVPQQCGVRNSYETPAQLGSDRWAALIGAWHLYGCACVVANVGTTMTVDALSGEGVFLGGFIVPGPELMREALARNTAQLQEPGGAFYYFPDRTADAIASGAVNALAGAIERMLRYMEEAGQGTPLIVLSGGSAALVERRLNARIAPVDNLVLEGLLRIARDAG